MKHVLFVLWFPLAITIFFFVSNLLTTIYISFNLDYVPVIGNFGRILIFIVSAVLIGELTLFLYKRLYKAS